MEINLQIQSSAELQLITDETELADAWALDTAQTKPGGML
jgi:hypothetical protein